MTFRAMLVAGVTAFLLGTAGQASAGEASIPGETDGVPGETDAGSRPQLSQEEEVTEDFLYELPPCGRGTSPTTLALATRSRTLSAQTLSATDGTSDGTFECADAGKRCFVGQWKKREDFIPYRRWVHQRTRWCARNGWVVSTRTSDWASSDPPCGVTWGPETRRTELNASIVHLATRAQFTCTLYFFELTDWVELRVDVLWNGKAYKR